MSDLILVPVVRNLVPLTTAVLYTKQARAYLKISSAGFNKLVKRGIINRYTHSNGKRPFFSNMNLMLTSTAFPDIRWMTVSLARTPKKGVRYERKVCSFE